MKTKICLLLTIALLSVTVKANDLFNHYNYSTAAATHGTLNRLDSSRSSEVVGKFKMIATASHSYRGDFQRKEINGLTNQDASVLSLQILIDSAKNEVQIYQFNLGKKDNNQGPAVIVFTAEGLMTFAQYSYKNGQVSDDVYFISECRLTGDAMLLCGKRFMVQDVTKVNPQQAAMNNTIVGYDLYTR